MRALSLAVLAGLVIASPAQLPLSVESNARPRPLVIWHGLGDTAHSEGMESFADYIKQVHPGIYVHSVISPDNGNDNDQRNAGWVSKSMSWVDREAAGEGRVRVGRRTC